MIIACIAVSVAGEELLGGVLGEGYLTVGDGLLKRRHEASRRHGFGTGGNPSASLCTFHQGGMDVIYFNSAIIGAADGKLYCPTYENFGSNPRGTPVPLGDAIYYGVSTSVFRFPLPCIRT